MHTASFPHMFNKIRYIGALCLVLAGQNTLATSEDDKALDTASCAELYALASALEPGSQHFVSPLFNSKTDSLAVAIGSVTTVGYYYFGFRVGREYYGAYNRDRQLQALDAVRRQLAQNYCFQKY